MKVTYPILLVSFIAVQVFAAIPISDLKLKVTGKEEEWSEDFIEKAYRDTVGSIPKVKEILSYLSLVPVVGTVADVFSLALDFIVDEKAALGAVAGDEIERAIRINDISKMKAQLDTVRMFTKTLNRTNISDDHPEAKRVILTMFFSLVNINNLFYRGGLSFNKYPIFAYIPLTLLKLSLWAIYPLFKHSTPLLADNDFNMCKLLNTLEYYKELVTIRRLHAVKFEQSPRLILGDDGELKNKIGKERRFRIWQTLTNSYGTTYPKATVECDAMSCKSYKRGVVCTRDLVGGQELLNYDDNIDQCLKDYFIAIKVTIEKSFRKYEDMALEWCPQSRNSLRRLSKTGWWSFIYLDATPRSKRDSYGRCNTNTLRDHVDCDPLLKIHIMGEVVFTSNVELYSRREILDFILIHETQKISSNSLVTIELWDSNIQELWDDDELMASWTFTLDTLPYGPQTLSQGMNSIDFVSIWRNSYLED